MDIDYVVGSGETMISTIAFKYGTTSSKLLAKNPKLGQTVSGADLLEQGTELKIPTNLKQSFQLEITLLALADL